MGSTIVSSSCDWLCSEEQSFIEWGSSEQDSPRRTYLIPEDIGSGWVESMHLPLNQVIRHGRVTFKPEVSGRLYPVTKMVEHFKEPVLCIQSVRTGLVILSDHNHKQDLIINRNASLFQHFDHRNSSAKMDTSEDVDYVILIIGDSVLRELFGEESAASLLRGLRVTLIPSGIVNKVPNHINAILHSAVSDHLTGATAKLHAQSKVLDYLCSLYKYFATEVKEEQSSQNVKELIHQVHNDLIQLQGKVPALGELAKHYDISVKQLSHEFRNTYKKSLFSYISEVRLNEAQASLQKTDTPMKTIAKNLGYSHVNHFITAFNRQFGYSPGSLRKKNNTAAPSKPSL